MYRNLWFLTLLILITLSSNENVLAKGNDLIIKDGFGEQVNITHGFWGRSNKRISDRFGDKVEQKEGLFGGKETNVNVLGNKFHKKKAWFGGSDIEGHSILGDSISSKKGIFGRRKTTIDLSGISTVVHDLLNDKRPNNNPVKPDVSGDLKPIQ